MDSELLKKRLIELNDDIRSPLYVAKNLLETHLHEISSSPAFQNSEIPVRTKLIIAKTRDQISSVLKVIHRINRAVAKDGAELDDDTVVEVHSPKGVSLRDVLKNVVHTLKEDRYLEHVLLVESLPSDLPFLNVNRIDLEEIFFNLIMNGAQAMLHHGSGQLTIDAIHEVYPKNQVHISFRDGGVGISDDVLPYIFEPFCGGADEGGTGFGLYIVKELVEANHGEITVESNPHMGTTFSVTFPVATDLQPVQESA